MSKVAVRRLICGVVALSFAFVDWGSSCRPVVAQDSVVQRTPNSVVQRTLDQWESLQSQVRQIAGPLREPEFDFALLKNTESSADPLTNLPNRLVLVLGGLQGCRTSSECFAEALQRQHPNPAAAGFAVFVYPNDGSIRDSGEALRHLLKFLHMRAPNTRISIVAHSMGGLVARQCLEHPLGRDEGPLPVDELIMICPPNHGSVLAQYADALEFSDAVTRMKAGNERLVSVLKSLINDGLGEACEELVPGSAFLRQLNALPRAAGVRYHIVAGTAGPVPPILRLATTVAVDESFQRTRIGQLPAASELLLRANELLTSDEFARGFGDGAVSVASAQLPGVFDLVQLPIHHAEWADVDQPQVQTLVKLVARWVSQH